MDERLKKIKDRNRFYKYGGMELVKELILRLPDPEKEKYKNGYEKSFVLSKAIKIARQKMGSHRKKKHHKFLAETILRYAVGNGYLRPVEKNKNRYILTRKSRKLREQEKQKNSTSEAQNTPSESFVPAET